MLLVLPALTLALVESVFGCIPVARCGCVGITVLTTGVAAAAALATSAYDFLGGSSCVAGALSGTVWAAAKELDVLRLVTNNDGDVSPRRTVLEYSNTVAPDVSA